MKDKALKKVLKILPVGFADEAGAMSEEELRSVIVQSETNLAEIERQKEADVKLTGAKEIVKDLGGGYAEATKAQRGKISFALHCLEALGKAPESEV